MGSFSFFFQRKENHMNPVTKVFTPIALGVSKHSRTILTGTTIIATLAAIAIAIKDRPKYEDILEECEEDGDNAVETAKALAPAATPLIVVTAVAVGSALLNHFLTGKKLKEDADTIASMVNTYTVCKTIKDGYREKLGAEAAEEVEKDISRTRAKEAWYGAACSPNAIVTGHGNDLFWDDWGGFFFYSNWNYVEKVVNEANQRLPYEMWVGIDEIYSEWGARKVCDAGHARKEGWNVDDGPIELVDPDGAFDEELGKSYTIVKFRKSPTVKYERHYY